MKGGKVPLDLDAMTKFGESASCEVAYDDSAEYVANKRPRNKKCDSSTGRSYTGMKGTLDWDHCYPPKSTCLGQNKSAQAEVTTITASTACFSAYCSISYKVYNWGK